MKLTDDRGVKIIRKDKTSASGKDYTTYSMMISSKNQEGTWVTGFLDCQFKKGVEVNNKAKIKINNCFPNVREYSGKTYITWFITDFEVIDQGETPVPTSPSGDGIPAFMDIPEGLDSLPFEVE